VDVVADAPVAPTARSAAELIRSQRWGALGTTGSDGPNVSFVAYTPEADLDGILLFLSGLSQHTRNLLHEPRASLGVTDLDDGSGDPQQLRRVSLYGRVGLVRRESDEFDGRWRVYRDRFPRSARLLSYFDFALFRFEIRTARFVGGFARTATLKAEQLHAAAGGVGV
jgi:hypothetical protein